MPVYKRPRDYRPILSVQNAKTVKGEPLGYLTGIAYLAPSDSSGQGNVCTSASAGCRAVCLGEHTGRMKMPNSQLARWDKTRLWFQDRKTFLESTAHDIEVLARRARAKGLKPAVRLNGSSDLPVLAHDMAARFSDVQFYDYTKHPRPWTRTRPNYNLVFSRSEDNERDCLEALENGINVAMVFRDGLPSHWGEYRVIDGDQHDLRFLDPQGVIVGLTPKGKPARQDLTGFVQL